LVEMTIRAASSVPKFVPDVDERGRYGQVHRGVPTPPPIPGMTSRTRTVPRVPNTTAAAGGGGAAGRAAGGAAGGAAVPLPDSGPPKPPKSKRITIV
jgi:hypothetical protein